MLAWGVAVLAMGRTNDADEFFPLDFGRTWVYQDSGGRAGTNTDVVGVEQVVGDKKAIPIISKSGEDVSGTTFYRVEGDQVLVVASEQNKPLAAPYPILKIGPGKTSWEFTGAMQWLGEFTPMTLKGVSKRGPAREFQGSRHDTIEVTLDVVIGAPDGIGLKSHQVTVYARGIGLVELTQQVTINKNKEETKRKLISFQPGKAG